MFRKGITSGLFTLAVGLLAAGCSSSGSSSGGSTATSYSISGTLDVGVGTSAFYGPYSAGACDDGYYYQVYCMSFSTPPVAAIGTVNCSGSSGGFTVAGLPLNTPIGCFIRRATTNDDDAMETMGSIELPATGLGGTSSTISANGDIQMGVSVGTDGTIAATVTSGSASSGSDGASLTGSSINGIYKIQCAGSGGGSAFSAASIEGCKCHNSDVEDNDSYRHSNGLATPGPLNPDDKDPQQACLDDHAAHVALTDTAQFVDVHIHNATATSDIVDNGTTTVHSGDHVQAISVWQATDATTSVHQDVFEGVPDFGGALTWADPTIMTAITWATGSGIALRNGVTADISAPPANTDDAGSWIAWVQDIYDNSTGFTCHWGDNGVGSADANCLAEFTNQVMGDSHEGVSLVLPRVNIDRLCDHMGCDADVADARVHVEGLDFHFTDPWDRGDDQSAVTPNGGGVGANPTARYVFEKWEAFPGGGGGFTQKNGEGQWFDCGTVGSGHTVEDARCNGSDGSALLCEGRREQAIKFIPTGTGTYNLVFQTTVTVFNAHISKWSTGVKTDVSDPTIVDLCNTQMNAGGSMQLMTAVKQ